MAVKRKGRPGINQALFEAAERPAQEVHEVQEVQQAQEVQEAPAAVTDKLIGSTQGKKGLRLQRINMAFSDANHQYVKFESRRRGLSMTEFVNSILDEYRERV